MAGWLTGIWIKFLEEGSLTPEAFFPIQGVSSTYLGFFFNLDPLSTLNVACNPTSLGEDSWPTTTRLSLAWYGINKGVLRNPQPSVTGYCVWWPPPPQARLLVSRKMNSLRDITLTLLTTDTLNAFSNDLATCHGPLRAATSEVVAKLPSELLMVHEDIHPCAYQAYVYSDLSQPERSEKGGWPAFL